MKNKRIIITGSNSRFAKSLKKQFIGKNIFYTDRKKLNILDINSIEKNFRKEFLNILSIHNYHKMSLLF